MTGPHMHSEDTSALPQGELLRWRANLKPGDRVYWPPNGIVDLVLHQQHRWDVVGEQLIGVKSAPEHELRPIPGMAYAVNPAPLSEAGETQTTPDKSFSDREIFAAHVGALAGGAIAETGLHTTGGRLFVTSASDLRWNDENAQGEVLFGGEWVAVTEMGIRELSRREHLHWRRDDGTLERWDAEAEPFSEPPTIVEPAEAEIAAPSLPLSQIRVDGGTQARAGVNWETVTSYAELMAAGVDLPPVIVYFDGAEYWLADGFHRYHAAKQLDLNELAVEVKQGDARAARLHAAGANSTHGLPRTNDDKRRAVLLLLNDSEWAQWSDREIGRKCAVHHTTVATVRASLTGDLASERTYTTKHGTTATMNTAQIGQKAAEPPARPLMGDGLHSIEEAAAHAPHYAAYRDLVAAHPGRLALMLHSLWYTAWDESVEPIRSVMGYRVSSGVDQTTHRPMVSIWEDKANEFISLLTAANFSLAVMDRDGSVRLIEPDGTSMSMDEAVEAAHAAAFARVVDEDTGEIETAEPASAGKLAPLMSSESGEWYTPAWLIGLVHKTFGAAGIELDPASSEEANTIVRAQRILTREGAGFGGIAGDTREWKAQTVFLNPEYGAGIDHWVSKLLHHYEAGDIGEAILLVPARTDTAWFRRLRDYPVCFLKGRVKFWLSGGEASDPAPFPSAVFYLGASDESFVRVFGHGHGDVYRRVSA